MDAKITESVTCGAKKLGAGAAYDLDWLTQQFLPMVQAQVLQPVLQPTTLYFTAPAPEGLQADWRRHQRDAVAVVAGLLAELDAVTTSSLPLEESIGYVRYHVDAGRIHATVQMGPCPSSHWACPALDEKTDAEVAQIKEKMEDLVAALIEAAQIDGGELKALPYYSLGLHLYIDQRVEWKKSVMKVGSGARVLACICHCTCHCICLTFASHLPAFQTLT